MPQNGAGDAPPRVLHGQSGVGVPVKARNREEEEVFLLKKLVLMVGKHPLRARLEPQLTLP